MSPTIKEVTKFITEDGAEFLDLDLAIRHVHRGDTERKVRKLIVAECSPDFCRSADIHTLARVMVRLNQGVREIMEEEDEQNKES